MTSEIYIAMTGDGNELWAECLERNLVAFGYDKPYFEAWNAGDRGEFLRLEMKAAPIGGAEGDIKSRATTWFNRATRIAESENDLWLHRAGNDFYWSVSTKGALARSPTGLSTPISSSSKSSVTCRSARQAVRCCSIC